MNKSLEQSSENSIPKGLKLIYTAFMAFFVPVYWIHHGPANFLWISDVTLILAFLGLLFESRLLASMAAVGGLALETFWTIAFLSLLLFDIHITDIADYMFDSSTALWLRLLSLFHVVLPPLLIWLVVRLGYAKKALFVQIGVLWLLVTFCWAFTDSAKNINWVYDYKTLGLNPLLYLFVECLGIALILSITHAFLRQFSRK